MNWFSIVDPIVDLIIAAIVLNALWKIDYIRETAEWLWKELKTKWIPKLKETYSRSRNSQK